MKVDRAGSSQCPVSDVDPFSDGFLADPFPSLAELREAGPVVLLRTYGAYAVAGHEQVQAVVRDPATFSSAAGVGLADARAAGYWRRPSLLVEADPPLHDRTRSAVAGAVSLRTLRSMRSTFEREAEVLADRLAERGRFDAVPELAEVFAIEVFANAFGLREHGRRHLLAYGSMVFNGHGPRNHLFEEAMRDARETVAWVTEQCSREALRPGSLGAEVYRAADRGDVTEDEAALLVRSFLSAGVDTTVSSLSHAVLEFARFPDQWDRLRQDPSLAHDAFEEVVRLDSPVLGFFRTTTAPVSIGGIPLDAGVKVLVFFAGANRDPRRWQDPDRFDITRRTVGHMGFGTGVHNCVGATIARMEGEVLLQALARRIAAWHLAGEVRPRLNNTLRAIASLPVEITRS
jgi:cytochrome P450